MQFGATWMTAYILPLHQNYPGSVVLLMDQHSEQANESPLEYLYIQSIRLWSCKINCQGKPSGSVSMAKTAAGLNLY